MNTYTRFLVAALLMALAASASAAPIVIPKDTVVPVTLDTPLSSATSRVGDTFYAYHHGINGGGFPELANFAGKVESVTKASGSTAGQIGVGFATVHLPNGTSAPINGQLTSLDKDSVKIDPASGRLVGTSTGSKGGLKFVAYGAGAGLVIGQVVKKKALLGAIIGAAAGYLYGRTQTTPAVGKDVEVKAGTPFGILLTQEVTLPEPNSATVATSTGASPDAGSGWQVTFKTLQPVMSGNDLMVPFRSVMDSIEMPFDYDSATKTIRMIRSDSTQVLYTAVGTKLVYVDGIPTKFDTASRIVGGSLYVPASYIELLTQRTAYWNQKSGVLRIE